jgi:hypothetical protein
MKDKQLRQSHFKSLVAMAYLNGGLGKTEQDFLKIIGNRIGITQPDIDLIFSNPDDIPIVNPYSMEDKLNCLLDLVTIMIANRQIGDKQLALCHKIANDYELNSAILARVINLLSKQIGGEKLDIVKELLIEIDSKKQNINHSLFDNTLEFKSSKHQRFENNKAISELQNSNRLIKIELIDQLEPNLITDIAYTMTIYNLENKTVFGDNLQMSPKRMRITEIADKKIALQGFGTDSMNFSFKDYEATLTLDDQKIEKISVLMVDKNAFIEYYN